MIDIFNQHNAKYSLMFARALGLGWVPEGEDQNDLYYQAVEYLQNKLPIEQRVEAHSFTQHTHQHASWSDDVVQHECDGTFFDWRDHKPGDEIDLFTLIDSHGIHTQVYYKWEKDNA